MPEKIYKRLKHLETVLNVITGLYLSGTIAYSLISWLRGRPGLRPTLYLLAGTAALWLAYRLYEHYRSPSKTILLIADFEGPEPKRYQVTRHVYEHLQLALEKYQDVKVKLAGQAFRDSEEARAEGKKHKAAIVIWGWYGGTEEAASLSVHFELLRPPPYMPELGAEVRGQAQVMALSELQSFSLQMKLSAELAYLSLFTVGMVRYAAQDWDGAIAGFRDALSQAAGPVPLDQSSVHFYRGNAYYHKGDYDPAIADFSQAIKLQPDDAAAYYNRGNAYYYKGDYDQAITDYTKAIKLQPDYAAAYNNRGNAYAHKGNRQKAIADLQKALQLSSDPRLRQLVEKALQTLEESH